jgi:hypothetical protein
VLGGWIHPSLFFALALSSSGALGHAFAKCSSSNL